MTRVYEDARRKDFGVREWSVHVQPARFCVCAYAYVHLSGFKFMLRKQSNAGGTGC